MIIDPIADLLTRIRNAQRSGHRAVRVRASKSGKNILNVLIGEGFIESFESRKDAAGKFDEFEVKLKYYSSGDPAITFCSRVSKPGRRVYLGVDKLGKVHAGLGTSILSTSQGVVSDREARKRKIGGEVLCQIG